ncbi:MAG TPA: ribosome maturation factor RimM [Lachnospiraceae bacterium]|nr:ribosome maturation factor RimM [Lachnospiraceae bacterium]
MEDMLKVGIIASMHGVKGEVKVYPTTDDVNRFKKLKQVLLDTGKEKISLEIEGVKFFKQMVILKFKGIDSLDDAAKFKQKDLYILRKDAVKLKTDEYFIADLIGMDVFDEDGSKLGELTDVMITGANDVYIVQMQDYEKELLIPAIKECILNIDVEQKKMVVHLMEGLLDL